MEIYKKFGIQPPENMTELMQQYLDDSPRGKHGKHEYTLADYELTEADERVRFKEYTTKFGL